MNLTPYPPLKAPCKSHTINLHGDSWTANHLLTSNIHRHNQRATWKTFQHFGAYKRCLQLNCPPTFPVILGEIRCWYISETYFEVEYQCLFHCSINNQRSDFALFLFSTLVSWRQIDQNQSETLQDVHKQARTGVSFSKVSTLLTFKVVNWQIYMAR